MQKIKKEICIDFQILCGFLALACFPYTIVGLGGYTFLTINNSFADMSDQRTTENSNRKPMLLFLQNSFLGNIVRRCSHAASATEERPPLAESAEARGERPSYRGGGDGGGGEGGGMRLSFSLCTIADCNPDGETEGDGRTGEDLPNPLTVRRLNFLYIQRKFLLHSGRKRTI